MPAVSPGPVAANSNTTKLDLYIFLFCPPAKLGKYRKVRWSCHSNKKIDSGSGGTL